MFTGLIETVGRVTSITPLAGAVRIGIGSDLPVAEMTDGESVAVDGVCLTVTRREGSEFWADAVPETLSRSTLAGLRPGHEVNLERALRLGDRLGGHLVQGHVDATVEVEEIARRGDDYRIRVRMTEDVRRYVAEKGSVAIQGVSLTVSHAGGASFEVAVIPETLRRTTLGSLARGSRVNVEVDLVARYLETLTDRGPERDGPGLKGLGLFPTRRRKAGKP